ncbi:hypothetical protein TYRP_019701, partial [Tyrophagus putrescentiae]
WRESIAGAGAAQPRTARSETAEVLGFLLCVIAAVLALGCRGEHSCCGGSSAQLRAARSDLTWPLSTTDDEGLASAASEARGGGR